MPLNNPGFLAAGDINPSRFLKIDTTAGNNHYVAQAGANGKVFGISQEGTRRAPRNDGAADDLLAAKVGESLSVYGLNDVCLLELGGTVTQGDDLKSDADGKGVVAASSGTTQQFVGAVALESGVSGDKIRVQVVYLRFYPALA